jgi:hypothetical protein
MQVPNIYIANCSIPHGHTDHQVLTTWLPFMIAFSCIPFIIWEVYEGIIQGDYRAKREERMYMFKSTFSYFFM